MSDKNTQELVNSRQDEMERMNKRVAELKTALAAATKRAKQAEAALRIEQETLMELARENGHNIVNGEEYRTELMVYRILLTGAMAATAAEAGVEDHTSFSIGYFMSLMIASLQSGAFAACDWPEIIRVAKQLGVHIDSTTQEAQP